MSDMPDFDAMSRDELMAKACWHERMADRFNTERQKRDAKMNAELVEMRNAILAGQRCAAVAKMDQIFTELANG